MPRGALASRYSFVVSAIVVGVVACGQSSSAVAAGDPAVGETIFELCAVCHGAQAQGNQQLDAPKLSGREEWYLIRQLTNFRAGIRGTHEADLTGRQMASMSVVLDDVTIRNVVAYIQTLPDSEPPPTVAGTARAFQWESPYADAGPGDRSKGEEYYPVCGNCHGSRGEGVQALNAPRLSGREDWYLTRQLKYFRDGIRGGSDDIEGQGMALMAQIMGSDDQAIYDLVAYIQTL